MMPSNNARERDVERRLRRVESPEPPADLLDRIRGDIPEHLRPVDRAGRQAGRGRPWRLAAASLFLAIAAGFLAYRVVRQAPAPGTAAESRPTEAVSQQPATIEVGKQPPAAPRGTAASPPAPAADDLASTPADSPAVAKQEPQPRAADPRPADERPNAPPPPPTDSPREGALLEAPEPAIVGAIEVGPPAPLETERPAPPPPAPRPEVTPEVRAGSRQQAAPPSPTFALQGAAAGEPLRQRRLRKLDEMRVAPGPPSTGGTVEPNDQPWGDMFFRSYGTNPFVDTEDDPRSTFGLDVDTGSYTLARSYLERGHLPPPEAIRVEEFLNFFDYRDPAPERGEFRLSVEGAPSPWGRGPRYHLLRVGVRAREVSAAGRRDATLIFVVDVSGSMARDNRLGLVQRALDLLLDQLGPGDQVGLVVYGSRGRVLLEPSNDLAAARRAIHRLSTGGSTNAEEGLVLGYDLARRYYRPESINRLVLCSDGVANVGRTGPESILERIGREADEGIELTTVGFGMGNYNDVLMEQLADRGDGNYAYVDTLEEARRVFVENLTGTLQTIASDAKIQVEFDPAVVSRYRLLGYENRDVADHRFRDDTVDAGEIGAGHRVTALYEIKLAEEAPRRRPLGEVRLRYRSRESGQVVEESLELRPSQLARSWRAASPALRLAALAAELAEVLKRSYWAREIRPEELRDRARAVRQELGGDPDVGQLTELVHTAARLVDWPEPPPR